jgi:hypothetical protein
MKINQFFKPLKGCQIYASEQNPFCSLFDMVGECIKVDGNVCWFIDRRGDTDSFIWRFAEGNNKYFIFGA